jgi:hypothetical protein
LRRSGKTTFSRHVTAAALKHFLAEKPKATGLAVPRYADRVAWYGRRQPEPYEVISLGPLAVALTCGSLGRRLRSNFNIDAK